MRNRVVSWLAVAFAMPLAVSANTFVEDFDDTFVNPLLWNPTHVGQPYAIEKNGRLELVIPATSTGNFSASFNGLPKLYGDFEVTVTFDHVVWPANNGVRTGLGISGASGYYVLERTCLSTAGGEYILSDNNHNLVLAPYNGTQGMLKVVRTGTVLTGYYWLGDWQPVGSWTTATGPMAFNLWTWTDDSYFGHQDSVATFDNFKIIDQGALVSGNVRFGDFCLPAMQPVVLELRQGATVVDQQTVEVALDGDYLMATDFVGEDTLYAKGSHWLWQRGPQLTFGPDGSYSASFNLVNGDVDGDNEVGIGDYAMLSAAYNLVEGDLGWEPTADLNGDLAIDIADYAILSANYGALGDD